MFPIERTPVTSEPTKGSRWHELVSVATGYRLQNKLAESTRAEEKYSHLKYVHDPGNHLQTQAYIHTIWPSLDVQYPVPRTQALVLSTRLPSLVRVDEPALVPRDPARVLPRLALRPLDRTHADDVRASQVGPLPYLNRSSLVVIRSIVFGYSPLMT